MQDQEEIKFQESHSEKPKIAGIRKANDMDRSLSGFALVFRFIIIQK